MSRIIELKKELGVAVKAEEDAYAKRKILQQQRDGFADILVEHEARLVALTSAKNNAIMQFTLGEVGESDVTKARKLVDGAQKDVEEAAEIVAACDRGLATLPNTGIKNPFSVAVKTLNTKIWSEIYNIELDKANITVIPALERLYIARFKAQDGYISSDMPIKDFLAPLLGESGQMAAIINGATRHEPDLLKDYL